MTTSGGSQIFEKFSILCHGEGYRLRENFLSTSDSAGPCDPVRLPCSPRAGGREARRPAAAGDDAGREDRAARQSLGRQRHGRPRAPQPRRRSTSRRWRTCSRPADRCRWRRRAAHGLGHLTRVWGSVPLTVEAGVAELIRQHQVVLDGLPARCPGTGPRGVPDRLHDVRRDRLSGLDRVGCDLRSRTGRADGGRDRARHGRGRRAPRVVAGAGRRPRLPLGSRRRDDRRGSVSGRDARFGVRPGAAECRRAGDAEAFRRVLGVPGRAQPRAGVDGPARVARHHPADVRDRDRDGRRGSR